MCAKESAAVAVDLQKVAEKNNTEVVVLGHGSYEDGMKFLKYFPKINSTNSSVSESTTDTKSPTSNNSTSNSIFNHKLVISTDYAIFPLLSLYRAQDGLAGAKDFLGPSAWLTAVPSVLKSLTRPGVLSAKIAQPLPGAGDFKQMGGVFLIEGARNSENPEKVTAECLFSHIEKTPGANLSYEEIVGELGWDKDVEN